MRAILLAAGLGTRLRPITDTVPKCLVPVKGEPLLEIWLNRLSAAGVGPFLINTHYLANQVNVFTASSRYAEQITLVHEPVLRGTAATLIDNLSFFDGEDGMLVHADNYCLADFKDFVRAHSERPSYCLMTMMTFRTDSPSECGIVELDEKGVVQAFYEKIAHPPGNIANGAIYILSKEMINIIKDEIPFATDFSTEVLGRFTKRIYTFDAKAPLVDIGTPERYALANR